MRWLAAAALAFCSSVLAFVAEIKTSALPLEARQTLALIRTGGPYPYSQDGKTFQNREKLLPMKERGYYREYTVKTPGAKDRGARRIVGGGCKKYGGVEYVCIDYFYTDDHYRSFRRIIE
ncbi:MAG TPA: ribonuclease domain-containing protein [Burkholderiales bacterium]|nr:ribonuclease domain-containing protein [Burkholderiales bacterium]